MEIGKLHVLFVHFPIALALSTVLADFLFVVTRKDFFRICGIYCLVLAAIAIIPTAFTGDNLLDMKRPQLKPDYLYIANIHANLAVTSLVLVISAAVIRGFWKNHLKKFWLVIYSVLIVLIFGFISLTGHYGGMLAFGKDYLSGVF